MNDSEIIDNMFAHLDKQGSESEPLTDKKEADVEATKETIDNKDTEQTKAAPADSNSEASNDNEEDGEKTPFHEHPRWKEVLAERKQLREAQKEKDNRIFEMERKIKELEARPLKDEDFEGMTPTEIREAIEKQTKSEIEYKQLLEKRENEEADKYIANTLQDLKDAGHTFDENELLDISVKYTEGNIEKAFDIYQKFNESKQKGAESEAERAVRLKQSESNTSKRSSNDSSGGYVRGMGWDDVRANMK